MSIEISTLEQILLSAHSMIKQAILTTRFLLPWLYHFSALISSYGLEKQGP